MSQLNDIVSDFLVESYENLDQLDRDLVTLEQDPSSRETLASIFRTVHTIKGTCGFLGFGKLESVTHAGENLLSRLRDGELRLTGDMTTGLLALVDAVREMLGCIESQGAEGEEAYAELVQTLIQLQECRPAADLPATEPAVAKAAPKHAPAQEPEQDVAPAAAAPSAATESLANPATKGGESLANGASADSRSGGGISESNIRVDVSLLDKLMNRVGELVLARNLILQFSSTQHDPAFQSASQRLNLITTELQEGVMKTRMQPIGNIWSKFPRVVRDLATQCGKQVRIEMQGKETELDKTIIEAIKDPLTHLVRNSVDHGIELPEVRRANGKPLEGCLLLRAFHEGGQVNIEICDDGAGLNLDRVKQKAIDRGLITSDQASRMGDRELAQLIFLPGFSTAEKVTNVSGRGVGMDVVKTNIERIGGTVDIQSRLGSGTTIKIKIPLTLAIIPALTVACGGARYAIPQVSLLELVRLEGEEAGEGIENMHGAPVYRLRGRLLPLVHLREVLGLECVEQGAERDVQNIVVLRADDRQFGLVVDGVHDTEEIVVKPLAKQLKNISVYAGATIMGDGRVALILDVFGIAQSAGVVSGAHDRPALDAAGGRENSASPTQTLLVVGLGANRRMAIPLLMVDRLEEIPACDVEIANSQRVVQYRDQILPLIDLADLFGVEKDSAQADQLQVVVYSERGRRVGLVVDRIVDIVESMVDLQRSGNKDGITGSAVVQGFVTDLIDVPAVIQRAEPQLLEHSGVLAV